MHNVWLDEHFLIVERIQVQGSPLEVRQLSAFLQEQIWSVLLHRDRLSIRWDQIAQDLQEASSQPRPQSPL